jgi:hypothetical protein
VGTGARPSSASGCEVRREGAERALAAEAIDRAAARDGDDPCRRVARDAVARPGRQGGGERVLHRLLGEVPIAERADQRRHRAAEVLAERALDCVAGAQDAARSA